MRARGYHLASPFIATMLFVWRAFCTEPVPDLRLFVLTSPQLRTNSVAIPELFAKSANGTTAVELSSPRDVPLELAAQRYATMTGQPLLSAPLPRYDTGGAYGFVKNHVLDPITTPEVVKVGKAHLTGGLVGALKTRNPFCLLNPLVFAVDW